MRWANGQGAKLAHLAVDAGADIESDAAHHLALGKWDEAVSQGAEAIEQYRRVVTLDVRTEVGDEAAIRLDRLLRKHEGWLSSQQGWIEELQRTHSPIRQIRALSEHRLKNPVLALDHAKQALATIESSGLDRFFAVSRPALDKRLGRLQRKVYSTN